MSEIFDLDARAHPRMSAMLDKIEAVIDSDPNASVALLGEAIGHALPLGDQALLSALYSNLGICNVVLHNPVAVRNFETALDCAEQAGRTDLKVDALHGLGRTFVVFGELGSALEYCEKAMQLARECGEVRKFPKVLLTFGLIFAKTGQFERCIAINREAAESATILGDKRFLALALNNLADTLISWYLALREESGLFRVELLDEAVRHAQASIQVVQQTGIIRSELMVAETLAHALEQKGNYGAALTYLEETLQRLQGHGFVKEMLDIHMRKGALLFRLGRVQDGIDELLSTRLAALKLGNYPHLADLLKDLCEAQEAQGDFKAALASMREYHSVILKQRDYRAQISAQIYAAKMDLERAQKEVESHKNRVSQLEDFNRSLTMQAHEDTLTGLPNRRALEESMLLRLQAPQVDFAFIMCDIDFFKKVNDEYSHLIGDDVLRLIGTLIKDCLRSNDMAARIGGEEFALVLDHCNHLKLLEACNRIRRIVESFSWDNVAQGLHITMSFGVTLCTSGDTLKSLMERADSALYSAKRNGRNRSEQA